MLPLVLDNGGPGKRCSLGEKVLHPLYDARYGSIVSTYLVLRPGKPAAGIGGLAGLLRP